LQIESKDRGLANATFCVVFANAVFFLLNFGKGVLIANYIGAGTDMDAYLAVESIPAILIALLSGALIAGVIPELSKIKNSKEGLNLSNSILNITIISASFMVFILIISSRFIIPTFFELENSKIAIKLSYFLFPFLITGLAFSVLKSIANTHKIFLLPALSPSIYILIIILCVILLSQRLGVISLGIGVLVGSILQVLFIFSELKKHGFRYKPYVDFHNPHLSKTARMTAPLVVGSALANFNVFVDRVMASRLSAGSVSALHYGYIPLTFVLSFFTVAISTSILPYFSEYAASNNIKKIKSTFMSGVNLSIFITLPVAVLFWSIATPLVKIVLERGAFTSNNTAAVSTALRLYALGLPFIAINAIIVRVYHALQKNIVIMLVAIPYVVFNILFNWILSKPLGHGGIALSTSIDYFIVVSILFVILNSQIGGLFAKRHLISCCKTILCTCIMAFSIYAFLYYSKEFAIVTSLLSSIIIGLAIYWLTALLIRHGEIKNLCNISRKILNR